MLTYDELSVVCPEQCVFNFTENCTESLFADCYMYPKRILDLEYLVPATIGLLVLFLTGVLGNLSVCTVLLRHPKMRTETNVYLFSLAVSDIFLLLFGLGPELVYYWQMYPYVFGELTCRLTKLLLATSTWASALTVVAVSIERYTAICNHTRRSRDKRRVTFALLAIWSISVVVSLPALHVYHVAVNPDYAYPGTGQVSWMMQQCKIPEWGDEYKYYIHMYTIFTVLFFFIPMVVLILVYTRIAFFIRSHIRYSRKSGIKSNSSEDKKIFKVLVAVVLTFFVCGLPFHYQNVSAAYAGFYKTENDTSTEADPDTEEPVTEDRDYHRKVMVVTAFFFYVSATINPILYNAMSKRFRRAFMETITGSWKQEAYPMSTVASVPPDNNSKTFSYSTVPTSVTTTSKLNDFKKESTAPPYSG